MRAQNLNRYFPVIPLYGATSPDKTLATEIFRGGQLPLWQYKNVVLMEVLKKTNSILVATKETGIYGKQKSNVNNNYCMSFCDGCDGEKTKNIFMGKVSGITKVTSVKQNIFKSIHFISR